MSIWLIGLVSVAATVWNCTVGDNRRNQDAAWYILLLPADWITTIWCCMELLNNSLSDRIQLMLINKLLLLLLLTLLQTACWHYSGVEVPPVSPVAGSSSGHTIHSRNTGAQMSEWQCSAVPHWRLSRAKLVVTGHSLLLCTKCCLEQSTCMALFVTRRWERLCQTFEVILDKLRCGSFDFQLALNELIMVARIPFTFSHSIFSSVGPMSANILETFLRDMTLAPVETSLSRFP